MNSLIEYNKILEKGVNVINLLANDQYIDDIAHKNSFDNADQFLDELNSILFESYRIPFINPDFDYSKGWNDEIVRLSGSIAEMINISKYDRKQFERDDKVEAKKLLDGVDEYINEISMFYNTAGQPIYDMDTIQKIMNIERINLLNSKGKKSRQTAYNKILDAIESAKLTM